MTNIFGPTSPDHFLKLNDSGSIDLTMYFLSTVGNSNVESESVFEKTERFVKIAPKDKKSLLYIENGYGLYKSVFTLTPEETVGIELEEGNLDKLADMISKSVAERLEQGTFPKEEFDYEVFLSYSRIDKDEARQIQKLLEQNGISCFLDEKSIMPGDDWELSLKKNLKNSRHLLLLMTPNSLKSDWVLSEWTIAWMLERMIVPVLLRCDFSQLPSKLQRYQSIDFHKLNDEMISTIFKKD